MSVVTLVCAPDQFPTFDDFYSRLKGLKLEFNPTLPMLPSPLFGSLHMPDLELSNISMQMVINQFMNWIMAVIQPMMNFVGSIPFPTIPELNLTLPDLLAGFNWDDMIARFKAHMPSIPGIPDPLFPSISMPDFEIVFKIQQLIKNYCVALIDMVTGLIDMVISKLSKKPFSFGISFPTLPTIPTDFEALKAMLASWFAGLGLPGFPGLNFNMPDPWYPSINMPEVSLMEQINNMFMAMVMWCSKKIGDFCTAIANFVSFNLPTICVPVPTVA